MSERSRRPLRSPGRTPEEVQRLVLGAAAEYPAWGPKTLHALLWPPGEAPVCERTVARILARAGRRCLPERLVDPAPHRFEREAPNELWQADFKRIGPRKERREALSVLDDATRFCIALAGVEDQTLGTVWETLWEAFGQFGLPEQILTDNGPAFRSNATWRWSSFDLRLMLLGIRPLHGRPYHPQTQGKVERFHGTLEREVRFEGSSEEELSRFRDRYNWVRPHHALAMRTPGMAKFAFSALVENASGRMGSVVWTRARNGATARTWTQVSNPRTNAQTQVRQSFAQAARTFANMTPAQAAAWNAYGQTITRTNPLNGKTYHPAGIDIFMAYATKFLQLSPSGTIPVAPPASPFVGDSISLTAESESPGVISFNASGPNSAGVTTELLIQKLPGSNRKPNPEGYQHAAFKVFTSGSLKQDVNVVAGHYAAAYRFVKNSTGQATELVTLPVMTIGLSVEVGSESRVSRKKAA